MPSTTENSEWTRKCTNAGGVACSVMLAIVLTAAWPPRPSADVSPIRARAFAALARTALRVTPRAASGSRPAVHHAHPSILEVRADIEQAKAPSRPWSAHPARGRPAACRYERGPLSGNVESAPACRTGSHARNCASLVRIVAFADRHMPPHGVWPGAASLLAWTTREGSRPSAGRSPARYAPADCDPPPCVPRTKLDPAAKGPQETPAQCRNR